MVNRLIIGLLILIGFTGCISDHKITDNSVEDKSKNRFIKSKTVNWLTMDLFLKPASFLIAQQVKNDESSSSAKSDVIKATEEMVYFDLRLSVNAESGKHIENYNVHSKFEQDQRIQYLAFSMQHDIYLEQNDQKIPCELYHFERNYSLSAHRTFTLGFPKHSLSTNEDLTFVFDSQYLQTGPLKIQYSAIDFSDASQIEL